MKYEQKNIIFMYERAYNGQTESNTVVHLDRDPVFGGGDGLVAEIGYCGLMLVWVRRIGVKRHG